MFYCILLFTLLMSVETNLKVLFCQTVISYYIYIQNLTKEKREKKKKKTNKQTKQNKQKTQGLNSTNLQSHEQRVLYSLLHKYSTGANSLQICSGISLLLNSRSLCLCFNLDVSVLFVLLFNINLIIIQIHHLFFFFFFIRVVYYKKKQHFFFLNYYTTHLTLSKTLILFVLIYLFG